MNGPFKQQMLIHFTCELSDHLCHMAQYEWHRLSPILGLCWQTSPCSRPPGNTCAECVCVRRCHYVCTSEWWWCLRRRTREPLRTREEGDAWWQTDLHTYVCTASSQVMQHILLWPHSVSVAAAECQSRYVSWDKVPALWRWSPTSPLTHFKIKWIDSVFAESSVRVLPVWKYETFDTVLLTMIMFVTCQR